MSRPEKKPAKPTIGERGRRFCYWNLQPLLEVSSVAVAEDVREQAYTLMEIIGEVLTTHIGESASADSNAVLDTGTAYILRFAAEAAAAMVGSLEVK